MKHYIYVLIKYAASQMLFLFFLVRFLNLKKYKLTKKLLILGVNKPNDYAPANFHCQCGGSQYIGTTSCNKNLTCYQKTSDYYECSNQTTCPNGWSCNSKRLCYKKIRKINLYHYFIRWY